jgi:ankyrin repeat domain-containing protein 50
MKLVVNISSYMEKISTLFMAVGRFAPRYRQMALIYPESKVLQSFMAEYFIVVVDLCHRLLKFTKMSSIKQIAASLSDSDLKIYQLQLEQWSNAIKDEVACLLPKTVEEEAKENSQFRMLSNRFYDAVSLRQKMKKTLRLLDACSMHDYQTTWKQTRKLGSTVLYNDYDDYKTWKKEEISSTLNLSGKLGSGKSVLLANIIDDLFLHAGEGRHVTYFFCRHDIVTSLKARTVIGCIARQMLQSVPNLDLTGYQFPDSSSPNLALGLDDTMDVLSYALPADYKAYVVVDGLDECQPGEVEAITTLILRLQEMFTITVCVSLRPEPDTRLRKSLAKLLHSVSVFLPETNPDIEPFIENQLKEHIKSQRLVVGNPALILEIQNALFKGSQGMFLWVALQIESLCLMRTDKEIRAALSDLPKDLTETFTRILKKADNHTKAMQRKILQLVYIAHRPLATSELREALGVTPGDAVWDPEKLLNNIPDTLGCCGCLVVVDEEELTVRLVHHSFKSFLERGPLGVEFWKSSARTAMADIIITYLNYGVFDTQVARTVVPPMPAKTAPATIIGSTLESSMSFGRDVALKLLEMRKTPNFDMAKILIEASRKQAPLSREDFPFFSFATSSWQRYVASFSFQNPVMNKLFLRLVHEDKLDLSSEDESGRSLLFHAIECDHVALVSYLVDHDDVDVNRKDTVYGMTALTFAAWLGLIIIVDILLTSKRINNSFSYETFLLQFALAGENGHTKICTLLLEARAKFNAQHEPHLTERSFAGRLMTDDRDLFLWAAEKGYKGLVKALLHSGLNADFADVDGRTPLSLAAENGQEAVVDILLEAGADPKRSRISPLKYAAKNGHTGTVKALLESRKTGVYPLDGQPETPLAYAAGNGHLAAVMQILVHYERVDFDLILSLLRHIDDLLISSRIDMSDDDIITACSTLLRWGLESNPASRILFSTVGSDVRLGTDNISNLLFVACGKGFNNIIGLLLASGVDPKVRDAVGNTPDFTDYLETQRLPAGSKRAFGYGAQRIYGLS